MPYRRTGSLLDTMRQKYGSYEGYTAHMREIASKGGKAKKTSPSGFAAMTPEQRREAARKGGVVGRRSSRRESA